MRADSTPGTSSEVSAGGGGRAINNKIRSGFSLVELMVVVAIIAILIAMAAPAYQDYTIRAKVSELVAAASAFKSAIAAKANSDATLASAGVGLTLIPFSGKITGGSVTDGGIITVLGSSSSVGTAVTIVLTPSYGGARVTWVCSSGGPAQFKYVPAECRN